MNSLSTTIKMLRKQYHLTQEKLSLKSGVGLRFIRNLEQGKETLRLDKVNQLLDFFNQESFFQRKRCRCSRVVLQRYQMQQKKPRVLVMVQSMYAASKLHSHQSQQQIDF